MSSTFGSLQPGSLGSLKVSRSGVDADGVEGALNLPSTRDGDLDGRVCPLDLLCRKMNNNRPLLSVRPSTRLIAGRVCFFFSRLALIDFSCSYISWHKDLPKIVAFP